MGIYKTSIISAANEKSFIDDFVAAVLFNNYGTAGSNSSRYSRGIAPIFLV